MGERRSRALIRAPSNLGLRPLRPGHVPGTWRAPDVLTQAGLVEALRPSRVIDLPRPLYGTAAQPGTRLRNGTAIRTFNLALAGLVETAIRAGEFPIVIGGDCSILLGALAGARQLSPLSLVHVDGHSDFRHPGNYDAAASLGAVAGMDLALATGRGEALLTDWPGAPAPLVPDEQVVQIGEREGRDPDFAWADINDTAITRIDVFDARDAGAVSVVRRTTDVVDRAGWPFWLHLDVDVLDQAIMPAVDSPGSPGIEPDELITILSRLAEDSRCVGLDVTIYDPDLDPDGGCAALLVSLLARVLAGANG